MCKLFTKFSFCIYQQIMHVSKNFFEKEIPKLIY